MQKKESRTLKHFYTLDKEKGARLIVEIMTRTKRSLVTVYHWINQRRTPCFLEQEFIQWKVKEIYGEEVPLTELFDREK